MSNEKMSKLLKELPRMDSMTPQAQTARIRALEQMLQLGARIGSTDRRGQARVLSTLSVIVSTRLDAAWWIKPMPAATRLLEGAHAALETLS